MLNDFVTGKLEVKRTKYIIPNLQKLIEAARKNGVPVIYSNDAHYPQDTEVVEKWGNHAIKGTKGAEVIPELKPSEKDYLVEKRTYSGFYETGLDPLLRSFYKGEGVKTVILGGLHGCRRFLQGISCNYRQRWCRSFHERRSGAGLEISRERLQFENNDGGRNNQRTQLKQQPISCIIGIRSAGIQDGPLRLEGH